MPAGLGGGVKKTLLLFVIACCLGTMEAQAHPFRTQYVCVPPVAPNRSPLEFEIRDGGQCKEGEFFMVVQEQKDGSVLLVPATPPLEPEEQKDWEAFKKYYGR